MQAQNELIESVHGLIVESDGSIHRARKMRGKPQRPSKEHERRKARRKNAKRSRRANR